MLAASPVIPGVDATEVIFASDQPQYQPLPVIRCLDGKILTRWVFNEEEKRLIVEQGYIYLAVDTFNDPLQPVMLSATPPDQIKLVDMPEGAVGFSEFNEREAPEDSARETGKPYPQTVKVDGVQ